MSQEQVMNYWGTMLSSGGCKNRDDFKRYRKYIERINKQQKQNPVDKKKTLSVKYIISNQKGSL